MQSKAALRQTLIARRRAINPVYRQQAAVRAAQLFAETPVFQQSRHIACYLAREDEFDCLPMIKMIWQAKKTCYLPVLSKTEEKKLDFVKYEADDTLKLNCYKIFEPERGDKIFVEQLELVIMPLVGFDLSGHRLGMGGGYYDRTFSRRDKNYFFGLAYAEQQVEQLPHDTWDIALDGVVTEKKMLLF